MNHTIPSIFEKKFDQKSTISLVRRAPLVPRAPWGTATDRNPLIEKPEITFNSSFRTLVVNLYRKKFQII